MSRQGSTKEKIVKLISEGNNTLSGITDHLGLAPSTVSKHLDDLEYAGVIQQKDNPHIKKWKYYQLAQNSNNETIQDGWFGINKNRAISGATVVILVALVLSVYFYIQGNGAMTYVPIGITDPPQVPYGTQALYINYSSISVHVYGNGASEWIPVNASGRLDLMSLINESQVLGGVRVGSTSTIDMMRFNITSANIVIDNVTYAVRLAQRQVTASVERSRAVNSSSGILIDFSPVVTQMYAQNSTVFVMVPSLRAQMIPSSGLGTEQSYGNDTNQQRHPLPGGYCSICSGVSSNLSLSGLTLYSSGNEISFGATVQNNANNNVTVLGIMLASSQPEGFVIALNQSTQFPYSNATTNGFGGRYGEGNGAYGWFQPNRGSVNGNGFYQQSGSNLTINGSALYSSGAYFRNRSIRIKLQSPVNNVYISGMDQQREGFSNAPALPQGGGFFGGFGFIVNGNGTLSLPTPETMQQYHGMQPGYVLGAHEAITFTYSGEPMRGFGPLMNLSNQSVYTVLVVTTDGIAHANVTAT